MKKIVVLIVLVVFGISINAQNTPPAIQWQKCMGGSSDEYATSIQQTIDGGYIVAGYTYSNDGDVTGFHLPNTSTSDDWIVKFDSLGNIQWQKCLGGSLDEYATSIQQTNDGGYIVAGSTNSNDGDVTGNHGSRDCWIVKLNSIGNIQWQKCLGGTGDDAANSIQQTNDGGYIIAGSTNSNDGDVIGFHVTNTSTSDEWIVKIDTLGNLQWQKCLGGSGLDIAYSIYQTYDGGYIVAGYSNLNDGDVTLNHIYIDTITNTYFNTNDYWIVKLDAIGNIQWQKSLGGNGSDIARSIQQTNDGGFIVAGSTNSNDGDVTGYHSFFYYTSTDYWVVKLDSIGNIQWKKCLGGTGGDAANSIQQTNDGGYIVAGSTNSNDGDVTGFHLPNTSSSDEWLVKLDALGNIQWQKCFGGTSYDYADFIQQTNDGGYIVAGSTISNDGDVTLNHIYIDTTTNTYYIASDCWIVKLAPYPMDIKEQIITNELSLYPNPTKETLNITNTEKGDIHIYNVLGEEVMNTKCNEGENTINVSNLAKGTYIFKMVSEKNVITKKLVIN